MMKRIIVRLAFSLPLVVALVALPGCGEVGEILFGSQVDKFLDEFNRLIVELQRTRAGVRGDVATYMERIEKLLDKFDGKVRELLRDDLACFVDRRVGGISDDLKTTLVMVERRTTAHLSAMIEALEAARDRVVTSGALPGDTLENILAAVLADLDNLEPFAGRLIPNTVATREAGGVLVPVDDELTVVGFAFSGRQSELKLVGLDRDRRSVWTAPPSSLMVNSDFRVTYVHPGGERWPSAVTALVLRWTPPGGVPVALATFSLKQARPEPPRPAVARAEIEFIGLDEKLPSRAIDVVLGTYTATGKTPLATWSALGAGLLWKNDEPYGTGPASVAARVVDPAVLYVEISMSAGIGGDVVHEYRFIPSSMGNSYYSRTHRPRFVGEHETGKLERIGFLREGRKHPPSLVLRDPPRLVAGSWRGRVRLKLHLEDGTVRRFDESPRVEFKDGVAPDGSSVVHLQWHGDGRELN